MPVAILLINVVVAIQVRRSAIHAAANLGVQLHHQSTSSVPTIMLITTSLLYVLFNTVRGIFYAVWLWVAHGNFGDETVVDFAADCYDMMSPSLRGNLLSRTTSTCISSQENSFVLIYTNFFVAVPLLHLPLLLLLLMFLVLRLLPLLLLLLLMMMMKLQDVLQLIQPSKTFCSE